MKKLYYVILIAVLSFNILKSQPISYTEAPQFDNSTSTARGPNGTSTHVYMSACGLVLASELTNIAPGTTLTSFGFTLNSGAVGISPTGNFTVYLQNTTDITYNKGTTFSSALTGMTSVYASTLNIPISTGATSVVVNLSTPFVYTGGGIYVAYDWYNPGPYSTTAAVYRCNSLGLVPGLASGASTSTNVATLATTAFRPCFLLGAANTLTNEIQVVGMEAPGRVAGMFNTPHNVVTLIKNASNATKNNIVVNLNVGGANTFANSQTITSLASGAVTSVTFAAFNPTVGGLNTLSVTLPPDQVNTNNLSTYSQSVTCNEWAMNPATVSYTQGSVGFNTGSGIIAVSYSNPIASSLIGIRGAVSTNTPSVGNSAWAVLLSASGATIATTNTLVISNTMLGTFQTFTFATPPSLQAGTSYYFGFAQPANTSLGYFPMGVYNNSYVPFLNYVTTTTVGGTPAALTSNLGYFGIEGIFTPYVPVNAPSQTINCGANAVLSATSTSNYTWTNGPSNANYSVTPLTNTNYTINLSNGLCNASNIVSVTVNPIPINIISTSSAICLGQPINLAGNGASSYTWMASNGGSLISASYSDSPVSNTSYTLTGANANGCSNSSVITITVNPLPSISVTSNTNIICLGSSATLTAFGSSSGNYTWSIGGNATTVAVSPSTSIVYTVVTNNNFNCINSATFGLTVNSYTPSLSASATSVCLGSQVSITAGGGATNSYTWSNGTNFFGQINVSPSASTLYTVGAMGQNSGCLGVNSISITVYQNPTVTATASRSVMCKGENNIITAQGASTYSWNTSEQTNTILVNSQVPSTVIYTVIGTDNKGCSSNYTLSLKINACTGITQLSQNGVELLLYPNPTNQLISLEMEPNNLQLNYQVINSLGQMVLNSEIISNKTNIDLAEQKAGIYFIQVLENNQIIKTAKIIKQ